jgi:hypothetical protein
VLTTEAPMMPFGAAGGTNLPLAKTEALPSVT